MRTFERGWLWLDAAQLPGVTLIQRTLIRDAIGSNLISQM